MALPETEHQLSSERCICVINQEGEIVGSYTGDLHNWGGELELLRRFRDTPGVNFQEFPGRSPGAAQRGFPELFFPRTTTPEEDKKELNRRNNRIVLLEKRLRGAL